ncbi:MAG: DUF5693 family protein [Chthonomonadales bacterium]
MRSYTTMVLYGIVAVASLAGLYALHKRQQVEALNRRVELTLDYTELRTLAQMTRQPLPAVLAGFRETGVTSVAITEDTLAALEAAGMVRAEVVSSVPTVKVCSQELLERIRAELAARGLAVTSGHTSERPFTRFLCPAAPKEAFGVAADYAVIRTVGVGLDPASVQAVRSAGLGVVARIGNFPGVNPITATAVLTRVKQTGAQVVVFQGTDVLGYRGMFTEVADAFRITGLHYGQIEFGKQRGDDRLSMALRGNYIRVHSIGDAEMGQLDESEIIERFVRAARERNIRLCYIRLPYTTGTDVMERNKELVGRIRKGIARGHEMSFGPAHPFLDTHVPDGLFALMGAGAAAGAVLALVRVFPFASGTGLVLSVLAGAACAALAGAGGETGRKLAALLAGIAFPTLACLRSDILCVDREESGVAARGDAYGALRISLGTLAAASAVTGLGILIVGGLLATRPFMMKANQFMGIKAQHAVPVLLIALAAIAGLPRVGAAWPVEWGRMKQRAAAFFNEPTRVGTLLLTLVALAALALAVARTGNDSGVGVSTMELKFRALLDRVLPVRPRTKEFLIGHPAWVMAMALWYRGRRKWALPLFVVGVVGQVSLLNTFCHIHTPLHLSIIRGSTGLVLGAAIGAAVFLGLEWAASRGSHAAN